MFGTEGIQPSDAVQGGLGDCWIHAAAAAVATDPRRIERLFEVTELNTAGVYAVNMYVMGIPVTVTVDDFLPMWSASERGLIYGGPSPDKSLWMPILEKAAAKFYGNYEMLSGGWMGPAVQALTGAPYYDTNHADLSVDALWNQIDKQLADGWMMTAGSHTGTGSDRDSNAVGVAYRHAYTVLETKKDDSGTLFIKMRNPWGAETYVGPHSDDKNDGEWWTDAKTYH